jgi:hypothetical protein
VRTSEVVVDYRHVGLHGLAEAADLLDLAGAEQGGGGGLAQRGHEPLADLQVERGGEALGLLQARVSAARGRGALPLRVDHDGALDGRFVLDE